MTHRLLRGRHVGIAVREKLTLAVAAGAMADACTSGGWWALPAGLVLLDAAQT